MTGLDCTSMAVSQSDPLRVYATFNGPLGIYRSDDGTSSWTFLPIPGRAGAPGARRPLRRAARLRGLRLRLLRELGRGESWTGTGWNLPPSSPSGLFVTMAADPFHAGHLLASFGGGTYGIGPGWLYSSTDYGASWQAVSLPQSVTWISDIAFDPATSGLVYLTTEGTGVYRSITDGSSWTRIDDQKQKGMRNARDIAIATQPRHVLFVDIGGGVPFRSLDGGSSWQMLGPPENNGIDMLASTFAGADSTRLYSATSNGLWASSDAGDTWTRAAGALGQIQTTALGYADADGNTILYAATNGGGAAASGSTLAAAPRTARAAARTLVGAGIYRYVLLPVPKLTLTLSGLKSGALKLGRSLCREGQGDPQPLRPQQGQADRAEEEGPQVGRGQDHDAYEQRQGRLQLEVQARQARQLPPAGDGRQDDQERGRLDEVAHVRGEVGGARSAEHTGETLRFADV